MPSVVAPFKTAGSFPLSTYRYQLMLALIWNDVSISKDANILYCIQHIKSHLYFELVLKRINNILESNYKTLWSGLGSKPSIFVVFVFSCNLIFTWMERPTEVHRFPELKLTHFKSIHDWFILVTEMNNYEIIKMDRLKVSLDKSLWETQIQSLGKMVQEI